MACVVFEGVHCGPNAQIHADPTGTDTITLALPDISFAGLTLCALFVLFAGLAKGFSGFGQSAIIVAGLTLFLPATAVIPVAIFLDALTSVGQLPHVWRHIDFKAVGILLISAIIGNFAGLQLLVAIDDATAKIAIAVIIGLASVLLLSGFRVRYRLPVAAFLVVGLMSGLVNGIAAVGGLIVVLCFAATGTPPAPFRANMIAYLFALDVVAMIMVWQSGLITDTQVALSIYATPVVFLGIWVGSIGFGRADAALFRRIVLILLAAIAVIQVGRSILNAG